MVLPGAWLAFGVPLEKFSLAARLAVAGVLSPLVVASQFFLFRGLDLSFSATVWVLVVLNAGSAWFLVRELRGFRPAPMSVVSFAAAYLLLAACLAFPWLVSDQIRLFSGHTLMHVGIVNQFPQGVFFPEDPELAGVPLAYPWLGHLYWAVLGWAMDRPLTQVYALTSLVWLLWTCLLFNETCRFLGASRFARRIALVWLGLGTNIAGFLLWQGATSLFDWPMRIPGDGRTIPWLKVFIFIGMEPFALGLVAAMILFSLEVLRSRERLWMAMTALALAGVGLLYPLSLPSALGFCGVLLLMVWWEERRTPLEPGHHPFLFLFGGIAVAVLIALANAWVLGQARASPLISFSGLIPLLAKLGTGLLALAPFLLAIAWVPRERLLARGSLLLLAGALPNFLFRIGFRLSAYNEHKLLFCIALCVVPVAALAVDRWVSRRFSPALITAVSLLLIVPAIPAIRLQQAMQGFPHFFPIREEGFYPQLGAQHPDSGWLEVIRTQTPPDTVIVLRRCSHFLPAFAGRTLWAPPEQPVPVPGYWMNSRHNLVEVRGYSAEPYDLRQAVLRSVFECDANCDARKIESHLRSLERPVAIVFFPGEGQHFLAWLTREKKGRLFFRDRRGTVVWLLEA